MGDLMKRCVLAMVILTAGWAVPVPAQNVYWIPASAHLKGNGGNVWRTDLAVVNHEEDAVTVEVRLHHASGVVSKSFPVAAGAQRVFRDVVATLTAQDASGSLEVRSTGRLTVRSRTFNVRPEGTFGQALDGVTVLHGLDRSGEARLVQLREDGSFYTNIGVANLGTAAATVRIELFAGPGESAGSFTLDVPPGGFVQDNRPFRNRFQRTDVTAGFATIRLTSGYRVELYGSVIDMQSGDPTTITMEVAPPCSP